MGAIRTCSLVPRSFSRTIDSAVETTAVIIPMNAMRPGHEEQRAPQLRVEPDARLDGHRRRGARQAAPLDLAGCADTLRTIVMRVAETVAAVFALSPLMMTCTGATVARRTARPVFSGMTSAARALSSIRR